MNPNFPESIRDEAHLEDLLSEPSPGAIEALSKLDGDLVVLGVGGKMGPTLARMVRRAFDIAGRKGRVLGVARFSQRELEEQLKTHGVEPIRCDLLDPVQVAALPDAPNVIAMAGMKFGATGQAALTWAMNCEVPALICRRYAGSRMVAFSTGNVYGLSSVKSGGSLEADTLAPSGEYPMSAVGRERMYSYFSETAHIQMAILRLNYAVEMRYGVLLDIGQRVLGGLPIDLSMGFLNAIWQGDANAMALASFAHLASPARILNIAGPEILSVRRVADEFTRIFNKPAHFQGTEAEDAHLSNAQESHRLFGYPRVPVQQMIRWIAHWLARGHRTLGKPTHFETRDGRY